MTRKRLPFNTGDCLKEVTAWAGMTVFTFPINTNAILNTLIKTDNY